MKSLLKKIIISILTWEARAVLARHRPQIVAVTGSVGKTSAKDALYSVVKQNYRARKSEKSFNGEIGIPLTILGLPNGWSNPFIWLQNIIRGFFLIISARFAPVDSYFVGYPEWLVLEVGADHPGDIESLTKWLRPDAVAVTRLSEVPVHVEFFKSPKEVFREKAFLVQALKDGGTLLLNSDDKDVMALREAKRISTLVTYGIDEPADFQSSNMEIIYEKEGGREIPSGITFKVNYGGNSLPVNLRNCLGRQHIYPALCALAFGESLGLNLIAITNSLAGDEIPRGRMAIIPGVKSSTIIDDTYNSSPVAVSEALRTLGEIKKGVSPSTKFGVKKIAVLGDMLELGKYSAEAHLKAGKEAVKVADILVTVGLRARGIAEGALNNGMNESKIFQFDNASEAGKDIEELIGEGDIVLVKGSQGMRMEKIVEEIMAEPDKAKELLVRKEKEWDFR